MEVGRETSAESLLVYTERLGLRCPLRPHTASAKQGNQLRKRMTWGPSDRGSDKYPDGLFREESCRVEGNHTD